jgi:hypothetical protein
MKYKLKAEHATKRRENNVLCFKLINRPKAAVTYSATGRTSDTVE